MLQPRLVAVTVLLLLLAGCSGGDPPSADAGDTPRQSKPAEPHVPKPEPFASDLTAYGMIVGPDGVINTVTSMGFGGGAPPGNLTSYRLDVTWTPPSLPLRICLADNTGPLPEIACAEGTGEAHIAWDNVTAGLPAGIPGTFRHLAYTSATPQVIGVLQQHAEGVVVN